ncbi:MAG TPA: MCE family protein [Actinomycetota bacterium]|nr:MCE family protein [Actinomycetota bacterium]
MKRLGLILASLLFVLATACSGNESIEVTTAFDDVGDMATGAPVTMADISIGRVSAIRLEGTEAVVTLELDPEARVPADVIARVRRTSVLGERIVDLVVPEGSQDSDELLADGADISETEVRSDLEDLVDEGSEVLGAVAASDLAVMIDQGGRGFGGRGEELRSILNSYTEIVGAYAKRGEMLKGLISNLDQFNATVATEAESHRQAVRNTARSIEVLSEESAELEQAIVSLNRLAVGGEDILDEHLDEMQNFFGQTRTILGTLEGQQKDIELLLKWAPNHNNNTQLVEYFEFNQVIQDFVICGLNDNPNDPARRCIEGT